MGSHRVECTDADSQVLRVPNVFTTVWGPCIEKEGPLSYINQASRDLVALEFFKCLPYCTRNPKTTGTLSRSRHNSRHPTHPGIYVGLVFTSNPNSNCDELKSGTFEFNKGSNKFGKDG